MDFDPVSYMMGQKAAGGGGGGGSSTLAGLTDVDISNPTDGQTLIYNATSEKWENGAGGLPAPTAADVGKVMSVVATPVPGAVIVPEQTAVQIEGEPVYMFTDGEESLFTPGTMVIINVDIPNGPSFMAISLIESSEEMPVALGTDAVTGEPIMLGFPPDMPVGTGVIILPGLSPEGAPSTVTVSCSVAAYTYSWQPEPYIGYDVVVKLDDIIVSASLSDSDLHLMKGSVEECERKMLTGQPITALVYYNSMNDGSAGQFDVSFETYTTETRSTLSYGNYVVLTIKASSNNTKRIYLTESGLTLIQPQS